jgi:hypothetical protein
MGGFFADQVYGQLHMGMVSQVVSGQWRPNSYRDSPVS